MTRLAYHVLVLTSFLVTPTLSSAQENTAAENTVAEIARVYENAFNAGHAEKVAALHAKDAEWIDSDGQAHSGRAAIRAMLTQAFATAKGRTIGLTTSKVRPLTENVIIDRGTAVVTDPDGGQSTSSYTTVYGKEGEQWLIAQITETAPSLTPSPASELSALRWLEGTWKGGNTTRPVTLQVNEAQNGNFLTINYSFGDNGEDGTSTEVIGYDASDASVRSWTFDSEGGFSEAAWQPDGLNWLLVSKSVNPDGTRASAQLEVRPAADGKSFVVEGYNRESGGTPLPKLGPIKFTAAN